MYRIIKDEGATENVYLINTDTKAALNLGIISPALIKILEEDDFKIGIDPGDITFKEKWNLKVSDEVKDELRKLAMPIKDQGKKVEEEKKSDEPPVDILNIIYGLA